LTGTAPGDLVAALRAELASIEPARKCDRIAERAGLGSAARGRARTPSIGRLAVRLDDAVGDAPFEWETAADHCRVAFLRGAFLAHGSLSVTTTGTHLELVVDADQLDAMARRLAAFGLSAGARIRRGRGVLTWKIAESVTEFLRRIGASAATLELESQLVSRSLTGHLNRVVNAENANLKRAVVAAHRQVADIRVLEERGELRRLPRDARRVAAARRRAPEATFSELAATLEMSRSHVQRAFEMIGSAALHDTETEPETVQRWT
jgi:DNA-binding protein WhiA